MTGPRASLRKAGGWLQAGGLVLVVILLLGVLPALLAKDWPEAGRLVAAARWIAAPVLVLCLLAIAVQRFRR